jgi:antiviral helicase SKI2
LSQANLEKIKREPCPICDRDLETCHEAAMAFERLTNRLHTSLLASPVGKRLWSKRQLIVFKKDGIRMAGVLLNDGIGGGPNPQVKVLAISLLGAKRQNSDLLPCLPRFRPMFAPLPTSVDQVKAHLTQVRLEDVECVTMTSIKVRRPPPGYPILKRH